MSLAIVHLRVVPDFSLRRKVFHRAELQAVAILDVEGGSLCRKLEIAYAKAQNVGGLWHESATVLFNGTRMVQKRGGLRSLSVGDVVELEGEMYIVDVVGFMKLVEIEDTPGFFEITDIKES